MSEGAGLVDPGEGSAQSLQFLVLGTYAHTIGCPPHLIFIFQSALSSYFFIQIKLMGISLFSSVFPFIFIFLSLSLYLFLSFFFSLSFSVWCECVCLSLCLSLFSCLSICLSISLPLFLYLSLSLSFSLSLSLFLSISIPLSFSFYLSISISLSPALSPSPSIRLFSFLSYSFFFSLGIMKVEGLPGFEKLLSISNAGLYCFVSAGTCVTTVHQPLIFIPIFHFCAKTFCHILLH